MQPTLHAFATKLGVRVTDVLMFLLTEGMEGIHVNTKLDEETRRKVEERFKKREPIVEVQTATSESLPRNAVESPHEQPPFRSTGWSIWRDRLRID